tara:strand:+ start:5819 stop:6409 length:591 start_codon:yes stop_codon:yes gene_type:complete
MANEKIVLEIDPANIETISEEESKPKKNYVYKDPYWSNKGAKHIIVTLEYNNGKKATASIQDKDGSNPDYKAILEEFGEETLDKNTEEGVKRRDEQIKKRLERKEAEAIRARQEQLFGAKLQAFELDKIKDSTNTELKRLIRKAKSPLEVQAYTTILLLDHFFNDKTVTDLQQQTPNLMQKLLEIAEVTFDEKNKS